MIRNLAPANAPWFEHLTDSVRSLGEAALDWQLGSNGAAFSYDLIERGGDFHEGKVTCEPESGAGPVTRSPHARATSMLRSAALNHMHHLAGEYRHAAMSFAAGATWAIRAVHTGKQPAVVVLTVDENQDFIPGSTAIPAEAVDRYNGAAQLRTAHDRLMECLIAGEQAEDIAGQAYVADHEASQMYDLAAVAEGLADAAYTYGLLAERALQYVLLGPKETHRVLLAEQRAAQEQAVTEVEAK
ncbi:hypothetical protein ADL35_12430 [Streptomyces sp. NRRL WC-3753]|nr:hypothetical protein ADL35_12430 [Streptomyces sp. NRRL WC-3753]